MSWFPLPIKLNSDGFTLMMEEKDGATIFGCFIIILEIASTCSPRGTLIRSNGEPHDPRSLVRLSRMNVRDCDRCLQYCSTTLNWLIFEEIENPAPIPHEGAAKPQDSALYNSTVEDSTEQDTTQKNIIPQHLVDVLKSFKEMRTKIKKPATDRAIHLIIKDVEKWYPEQNDLQIACIENSIKNSWQGVFELKTSDNKPKSWRPAL